MLVQDFKNTVGQYDNFAIWDVNGIDDFFSGNGVLKEIFEKEYHIPLKDLHTRRSEIVETDNGLMAGILDLVADKHFFVFTLGDQNHNDLIHMNQTKVMSFGVDIVNIIKPDHVYILMMDKAKKAGVGI